MKKMKLLCMLCVLTAAFGVMAACGGEDGGSGTDSVPNSQPQINTPVNPQPGQSAPGQSTPEQSTPEQSTPEQDDPSEQLKEITGVTFQDATFTYDGEEKSIVVSGEIPVGVQVSYEKNKGTNAGTYNGKAVLSGAGYKTLTLQATLTIRKADITGISFEGDSVEYDTLAHSIQIVGNLPSGVTVLYTYNGVETEEVSAVGTYEVQAIMRGANYNELVLTATLKIKSTEEQLYSINHNGTIYFQNNLDSNKLYQYTGSGIVKTNNDTAQYMISDGTNMYYYSASLFSKAIKVFDDKASQLYSVKGEYLATDGTYIYYAVNNTILNTDENGIYRYALDGSQETPTRLTTDKAAYLCCYNGNLYYSNLSEDKSLYVIPVNAVESKGVQIWEEAVSYILEDNGVLYFDSDKGIVQGSAIYKYTISSGLIVKLTSDSGKYLTKVGSDLYYVNNDLLSSTLFGDGIYKVSTAATSDRNLPGNKVLSAKDNGYSSLTSDGQNLYYYKLNDKHFYQYSIEDEAEQDLMKNFVVVDDTLLSGEGKLKEYKGEIYYTNPLDSSCLYKYNPMTNQRVKVLAESVADIWFNDGYMYYSTFVLTNYALYRMDLETQEVVKVNSKRCENLLFENGEMYYLHVGAGSNSICKMNKDGVDTVVYDDKNVRVTGFEKVGDTFYFVVNPAIGYQKIHSYTLGASDGKAVDLGVKAFEFSVVGDKIYYYDDKDNALKCCNLDGSSSATVMSGVDINDMYVSGNALYISSFKTGKKGVYKINLTNHSSEQISAQVGEGFIEVAGKVYFLQTAVTSRLTEYPEHHGNGDGKLYVYDGTTVTKKA